jgi:hypothetical protein
MRRRLLEPRSQAELQFTSGDEFQHLMLGMIAKLSPCSEERLLDVVAGQAGRKSLRSRIQIPSPVRARAPGAAACGHHR